MRIAKIFVALAATALVLVGCANHKEPAEKAMAQVESSLAEFRADAEKYAPDDLKGLDESITTLKTGFANKDYSEVLTAAPSRGIRGNVAQGVASPRQRPTVKRSWPRRRRNGRNSTPSVPPIVDAIQSRVDTLTQVAQAAQGRGQGHIRNHQDRLRDRENRLDRCNRGIRLRARPTDAVRKGRAARAKAEDPQAEARPGSMNS